jgi:hypothetical protein
MKHTTPLVALITATLVAAPAFGLTKDEQTAFEQAGFVTCDAKLFALAYGETDLKEAVSIAGQKIIGDDTETVRNYIADGRKQNNNNLLLCPPEETYSTADIALFAEFWDEGKKKARSTMSEKLLAGEKESIDWAIAEQKKKNG